MLSSSTPKPGRVSRPRPPGSRRSSARQEASGAGAAAAAETARTSESSSGENSKESSPTLKKKVSQNTLLPSPALEMRRDQHRSVSMPVDATMLATSLKLERDLDLDLPSDLTAALESSMQRWPSKRRYVSESNGRYRSPNARRHAKSDDDEGDVLRGKLHSSPTPPQRRILGSIRDNKSFSERDEAAHSDMGDGDSVDRAPSFQHRTMKSIDSTNTHASSETSFDAAWVGGLPREELENLLFESRQIIKDRERDLGIAATIGQALLEKNISLRSRHEGIVSRFSSINNLSALQTVEQTDGHQIDPNTPLPRYTPPQSDGEAATLNAVNVVGVDSEQITPRPDHQDGFTPHAKAEYFPQFHGSPAALRQSSKYDGPVSPYTGARTDRPWDSPTRKSHYVRSTPVSPGDAIAADVQHAFPPSDTHRRLELISMQNDELLDQIAQLQHESERAKREGGKRQKKLIREIDGLRSELDAAESRNTELERTAAEQRSTVDEQENDNGRQRQQKKKMWRRRGTLPWKSAKDDNAASQNSDQVHDGDGGALGTNREHVESIDQPDEARSASHYARSESEYSVAGSRQALHSEAERAIVAQLMAKVRELEEINSALIEDAHERDGRIGRFVEDSERLRDLYDAAESEVNESFSAAASMQDLHYLHNQHHRQYTQFSPYGASPTSVSRRAAGNRYLIEGRRTIRAAMRSDRFLDQPTQLNVDDVRFDSSAENSPNSAVDDYDSPTRARHIRRAMRPRILLTPSCEDMQAQAELDRQAAAATAAAAAAGSVCPTTNRLQVHVTRSDMSLRERYICEDSSEEDEDMDNSFDTRSVRRSLRHRASEGNMYRRSPQQTSRRTLSSELSGGKETQSDLSRSQSMQSTSLHHSVSQLSLGGAISEAGSDIADVQWSTSSFSAIGGKSGDESDVGGAMIPFADSSRALTVRRASNASDMIEDGLWYASAAQEIVPHGALKDDGAPTSHEHYVKLEKMSSNLPVHWADDEDFGKPITERDARNLGLLEGSSDRFTGSTRKGRSLLSWITPKGFDTTISKGKGKDLLDTMSASRQIESVEDAARRHELESLLRAKRNAALHDRVVSGQLTVEEAHRRGAYDHEDDDDYVKYSGLADYSFEAEVTKRAFAYRSIRRRAPSSSSPQSNSTSRSPARRRRGSGGGGGQNEYGMTNRRERSVDSNDAKPATRTRDYTALTLRQRYKPSVVKERLTQFSSETITWALAWATFSVVMVLAFVSAFARGPKRLLYGHAHQA